MNDVLHTIGVIGGVILFIYALMAVLIPFRTIRKRWRVFWSDIQMGLTHPRDIILTIVYGILTLYVVVVGFGLALWAIVIAIIDAVRNKWDREGVGEIAVYGILAWLIAEVLILLFRAVTGNYVAASVGAFILEDLGIYVVVSTVVLLFDYVVISIVRRVRETPGIETVWKRTYDFVRD